MVSGELVSATLSDRISTVTLPDPARAIRDDHHDLEHLLFNRLQRSGLRKPSAPGEVRSLAIPGFRDPAEANFFGLPGTASSRQRLFCGTGLSPPSPSPLLVRDHGQERRLSLEGSHLLVVVAANLA